MRSNKNKKIKFAVMGLGHIAQVAVLPAFKHSSKAQLWSLISEDPVKLKVLGKRYKIPQSRCFDMKEFPACLTKSGVHVLYLATPNDTHCELAVDALNQGSHVLCEKPLAVSVEECEKMIKASEYNSKLLMTAYRLHFEQANLEVIKLASSKKLGDLKIFNSTFTMQIKDKDNIRLNPVFMGGGPLWDIGIYCLNAARGIFKDEPIEVFAFAATSDQKRFDSTNEMISVTMKFPHDRLASFMCSFGADSCATYDVIGTKGRVHLERAYDYATDREMDFLKDGKRSNKKIYPKRDQFAAELDYFSQCVLEDKIPEPSAFEGRADVRVIESILKSLKSSAPVKLPPSNGVSYPNPELVDNKPPVARKPKTIHVKDSH